MPTFNEACDKIRAISADPIPCVFLGVQWVANIQPDDTEWYHSCGDECVDFARKLLSEDASVEILAGIWLVETPHFGSTQLIRIGNKYSTKLLLALEAFGFNPNRLFDAYTLDADLISGVQYCHAKRNKGKMVRCCRVRNIIGDVSRAFGYVPKFEATCRWEGGQPMQYIFSVTVLDFAEAAIEAINRQHTKRASNRETFETNTPPTNKAADGEMESRNPKDTNTNKRRESPSFRSSPWEIWRSYLLKHHKYGGDLHLEPLSPTMIERAGIGCSKASASRYFKAWMGFKRYKQICQSPRDLNTNLSLLAGDNCFERILSRTAELRDKKGRNPADDVDD